MSKQESRRKLLAETMRLRGGASVKELSRMLGVSEMTIRRDLKELPAFGAEKAGGAEGIRLSSISDVMYSLPTEEDKHRAQKEAIGCYAAALVEYGDIIVIDTGTTTQHIAEHLPINRAITALCYNINILMELRRNPGAKMMFAGGHYHPNTQMFASEEGVAFIKSIRAQKVFLSAAGVHAQLGVTCRNSHEVPTKKAVAGCSQRRILVADSSKFGVVRSAYFCELSEIDEIVTDRGLSEEWKELIEGANIKLHLV